MSVTANLNTVKNEIEECRNKNRIIHQVNLLAVSKTKPFSAIAEAYSAGQRLFGESYAQEACEKIDYARSNGYEDIRWYFIGPLQSNKTRQVAEHFDWVMSCDRQKIARRLNDQRPAFMEPLNVCIQVNISNEAQKSGVTEDEIWDLANYISSLTNLQLRGLMAVALDTEDENILRQEFSRMYSLYTSLQKQYPQVDTLSMGMTQDMDLAISCGSNQVRIGTKIFGARNYTREQG
ncbi:MAG: YggS family pyridoxal phosphate-dependent enzyme [Succinivibrionaceae bacterium]